MKIVIANNSKIPVEKYGGTERVIWYLGLELTKLGHKVEFLVPEGSSCSYANVIPIDENKEIIEQIPKDTDVVHFNMTPSNIDLLQTPYIITQHGNFGEAVQLNRNSVFVSSNHAVRYGSDSFVYNGLDWDDYSKPDLTKKRNYFHFLGKAAWRVKNVKGAINIIKKTKNERLYVLGGNRLNLSMGFRFTLSPRVHFCGMIGGKQKDEYLMKSKGLIFPALWHEPFGLAIIESLYFGCPVFSTPYGSMPELITPQFGVLSNKLSVLADAVENYSTFSNKDCHEYALENFNSAKMARSYLEKYERVLSGEILNPVHPTLKEIQTSRFLDWFE